MQSTVHSPQSRSIAQLRCCFISTVHFNSPVATAASTAVQRLSYYHSVRVLCCHTLQPALQAARCAAGPPAGRGTKFVSHPKVQTGWRTQPPEFLTVATSGGSDADHSAPASAKTKSDCSHNCCHAVGRTNCIMLPPFVSIMCVT